MPAGGGEKKEGKNVSVPIISRRSRYHPGRLEARGGKKKGKEKDNRDGRVSPLDHQRRNVVAR